MYLGDFIISRMWGNLVCFFLGGAGGGMAVRGLILSTYVTEYVVIAELIFSRGFLKGDKALGQVQLKLTPFDNKCEIHDCFDVSTCFVSSFINVLILEANNRQLFLRYGCCQLT